MAVALAGLLLDGGDDLGTHGAGTDSWYARIHKRLVDAPGIQFASVDPTALEVGLQVLGNSCFGIKLIQGELVGQQGIDSAVVQARRTVHRCAESVAGQDGGGLADGLEEVAGGVALEGGGVAVEAAGYRQLYTSAITAMVTTGLRRRKAK